MAIFGGDGFASNRCFDKVLASFDGNNMICSLQRRWFDVLTQNIVSVETARGLIWPKSANSIAIGAAAGYWGHHGKALLKLKYSCCSPAVSGSIKFWCDRVLRSSWKSAFEAQV